MKSPEVRICTIDNCRDCINQFSSECDSSLSILKAWIKEAKEKNVLTLWQQDLVNILETDFLPQIDLELQKQLNEKQLYLLLRAISLTCSLSQSPFDTNSLKALQDLYHELEGKPIKSVLFSKALKMIIDYSLLIGFITGIALSIPNLMAVSGLAGSLALLFYTLTTEDYIRRREDQDPLSYVDDNGNLRRRSTPNVYFGCFSGTYGFFAEFSRAKREQYPEGVNMCSAFFNKAQEQQEKVMPNSSIR